MAQAFARELKSVEAHFLISFEVAASDGGKKKSSIEEESADSVVPPDRPERRQPLHGHGHQLSYTSPRGNKMWADVLSQIWLNGPTQAWVHYRAKKEEARPRRSSPNLGGQSGRKNGKKAGPDERFLRPRCPP